MRNARCLGRMQRSVISDNRKLSFPASAVIVRRSVSSATNIRNVVCFDRLYLLTSDKNRMTWVLIAHIVHRTAYVLIRIAIILHEDKLPVAGKANGV